MYGKSSPPEVLQVDLRSLRRHFHQTSIENWYFVHQLGVYRFVFDLCFCAKLYFRLREVCVVSL